MRTGDRKQPATGDKPERGYPQGKLFYPVRSGCSLGEAPPVRTSNAPLERLPGFARTGAHPCRAFTPTSPSACALIASTAACDPAAVVKYGILS